MGGNLLKQWGLPPKRLNREEFASMEDDVERLVLCWFPKAKVCRIKNIGSKQSFGDLDIVVGVPTPMDEDRIADKSPFIRGIQELTPHFVSNGPVISFPLNGFQIDLILIEFHKCPGMARDYFSYGDTSNIIGYIAKSMGLSYGHCGLQLRVPSIMITGDDTMGDSIDPILLTDHPRVAREILGLSSDRWDQGFETEEDAFRWIVESERFDVAAYHTGAEDHKTRVRNRKRPMFQNFLKYMAAMKPGDRSDDPNRFDSRSWYMFDYYAERFPHVKTYIEQVRNDHYHRKVISMKYNGNIVGELSGLHGPSLGKFMQYLDPIMKKHDLLYMHPSKIYAVVLDAYAIYLRREKPINEDLIVISQKGVDF